ncbi:hypothetical protein [Aliikangiella sp. IMCC44632]
MIATGTELYNELNNKSYLVCHRNDFRFKYAILDSCLLKKPNIPKPLVMHDYELEELIDLQNLDRRRFKLAPEYAMSDDKIAIKHSHKWLTKRDEKFDNLNAILNDSTIDQYLYDSGIKFLIEEHIASGNSKWKSSGAYYNAINRYIAFGCRKQALLPIGLRNVGSNFLPAKTINDNVKKRGRKTSTKNAEHRGINEQDKKNILSIISYYKRNRKKFSYSRAYRDFCRDFCTVTIETEFSNVRVDLKPEQVISKRCFKYHFKQLSSYYDKIIIEKGEVTWRKDYEPKRQRSRQGVVGPSHRYEIDSTILDCYVKCPFSSNNESMGRPVLYVVVDVYTSSIVGYSISMLNESWEACAEALISAFTPKKAQCEKYGIYIEENEWPMNHICTQLAADNGTEYSVSKIVSMMNSFNFKFESTQYVAAFRGDLKALVERAFGILNEKTHELRGNTYQIKREDRHPSNENLYDMDDLHKIFIREILAYNNASDRSSLLKERDVLKDIEATPTSLWLSNIDEEMAGGNPIVSEEDISLVTWAALSPGQASVQENGIFFKNLVYHFDYADEHGWYLNATEKGHFKIDIKYSQYANFIYYQCEENKIHTVDLMSDDHCERFANKAWYEIERRLVVERGKSKELEHERLKKKIENDVYIEEFIDKPKKSCGRRASVVRKSMQPNIASRKKQHQEYEKEKIVQRQREILVQNESTLPEDDTYDYEDALYNA